MSVTSPTIVHLDRDLHEELKAYCHERGLRMKEFVSSIIRREMAEDAGLKTLDKIPEGSDLGAWAKPPFWDER